MTRINFDTYLLALARTASQRGTCGKRQVGAVIADVNKLIISIGYNGVASGRPHCIDRPCKAIAEHAPASHIKCMSQHAEISALIQAGRAARGSTMAITTSPCAACAIAIVTAGVSRLIFGETNRLWSNAIDYEVSPEQFITDAKIPWSVI